MDTVYTAMQKVLSVAPATAFPPLKVFWSVNNTKFSGDIAQGQIGTTFFLARDSGAEIYVLGKADLDTDEFDAPVIAHEWGHYYQASFSRDDSTGGAHSTSDLVDRRLAFSEGWGNAWSGIALGRSNYVDSGGRAGRRQHPRPFPRADAQSGLVPRDLGPVGALEPEPASGLSADQ
jgi:hypothetical protein